MLSATHPHPSVQQPRGPSTAPAVVPIPQDRHLERAVALLDGHGAALLELARTITATADRDPQVVAAVIWESAGRPDTPLAGVAARHALASRVYSRIGTGDDQPTPLMRTAARLSRHQRAALALYLYGAHTTAQVAALLRLPLRDTCLLLLEAADDLAGSPSTPAPVPA